jgi:hypothetical protein
MTLPAVTITKNVFTTAQAPASVTGILAILACASTGTVNQPGGYYRTDLASSAFGYGPLPEFCAYDLDVSNQPAVLQRGNATYLGSYGTVTGTVTGTSGPPTTSGNPYDHYYAGGKIISSGTIGVSGISFQWTLDNWNSQSGIIALGTANTYTIPGSGVTFDFGAGTLAVGDTWLVPTERPLMGDSDISTSLPILFNSRLPFEGVLIDSSATSSTVGLIDGLLAAQETRGNFKFAIINTRFKDEPEPNTETEAAYAAALATQFANQTSIRECVGADGAHVPSPISGYNLKRPTSLLLAAAAMAQSIGVDPSYVALGPLQGAQVSDANGNPYDHDEDLYPNLDGLRLVSLRSFAPGGPQGVYITNSNTIQPSGGSYPYLQHIRIMNRAASIAWSVLTTQLGRAVRKNPKPDPVTGLVYISEPDASAIEALVNDALAQPMKGQVSAAQFSLSRTDNMNAVPCIVTGILSIVALAYIKGIQVQAQFSKTIQTAI